MYAAWRNRLFFHGTTATGGSRGSAARAAGWPAAFGDEANAGGPGEASLRREMTDGGGENGEGVV